LSLLADNQMHPAIVDELGNVGVLSQDAFHAFTGCSDETEESLGYVQRGQDITGHILLGLVAVHEDSPLQIATSRCLAGTDNKCRIAG